MIIITIIIFIVIIIIIKGLPSYPTPDFHRVYQDPVRDLRLAQKHWVGITTSIIIIIIII